MKKPGRNIKREVWIIEAEGPDFWRPFTPGNSGPGKYGRFSDFYLSRERARREMRRYYPDTIRYRVTKYIPVEAKRHA